MNVAAGHLNVFIGSRLRMPKALILDWIGRPRKGNRCSVISCRGKLDQDTETAILYVHVEK